VKDELSTHLPTENHESIPNGESKCALFDVDADPLETKDIRETKGFAVLDHSLLPFWAFFARLFAPRHNARN